MTQEWTNGLNDDPLAWLVEERAQSAAGCYFSLWDNPDKPPDDPRVVETLQVVMSSGPLPTILGDQDHDGYWVKAGSAIVPGIVAPAGRALLTQAWNSISSQP